ncbi:MAG: DUF1572 family protein [Pirellulales bacterium]|nr:DUF1572 family protein [Pirellulales bacterium]
MDHVLTDLVHEFRRHKDLADRAMSSLDDAAFFQRPAEQVNPIALIVKHLAGNLKSRWTDFLTTDGEKPTRNRDGEFIVTPDDTRPALYAAWEQGWQTLFDTLASLQPADLGRLITIRGESQTVCQALIRGLCHVAYHTGQVVYLARLGNAEALWLTIAPGKSQQHQANYRKPV